MIWQIRDKATFAALRRSRRRARRGPLTVTWVVGPASEPPRVAYAIGRRVGGSVTRNRLRRRLRAIVSELELSPGAYLVAASPEAANLSFGELKDLMTQAVQQAVG